MLKELLHERAGVGFQVLRHLFKFGQCRRRPFHRRLQVRRDVGIRDAVLAHEFAGVAFQLGRLLLHRGELRRGEAVVFGFHTHGIIPFNAGLMTYGQQWAELVSPHVPRCIVATDASPRGAEVDPSSSSRAREPSTSVKSFG